MVVNQLKIRRIFMKIRLNSNDDDLLLGKVLSFSVLSIVVKSGFQHEDKYYPQIHIHECEHECEYKHFLY